MPKKLTYEYVFDFIKEKGYVLISKEYINHNSLLEIKCKDCDKIFNQTFCRFKLGNYHQFCKTNELFGGYRTPFKLKPIICLICKIEFQPKSCKTKLCSTKCANEYTRTPEYKEKAKIYGQKGGKISAKNQSRRSKNEVYFCELCEEYFGKDKVTNNETFFDGWDTDVIIHHLKLAIMWNGIWHYKQISKTQSLLQVQTRDKIKQSIIEKYEYKLYIIKDTGKYNKEFVKEQFKILLDYLKI
jgi:hypothetical protein